MIAPSCFGGVGCQPRRSRGLKSCLYCYLPIPSAVPEIQFTKEIPRQTQSKKALGGFYYLLHAKILEGKNRFRFGWFRQFVSRPITTTRDCYRRRALPHTARGFTAGAHNQSRKKPLKLKKGIDESILYFHI